MGHWVEQGLASGTYCALCLHSREAGKGSGSIAGRVCKGGRGGAGRGTGAGAGPGPGGGGRGWGGRGLGAELGPRPLWAGSLCTGPASGRLDPLRFSFRRCLDF